VIRYRVRVMGDVIVARTAIKRRDPVTEDLITVERRELTSLRGEPRRRLEELAGRRAVRGMPAGAVITSELLEAVPVVLKGDVFQAVSRVGLVESAAQVIAQGDGGIGDVIRVRIGPRNEELRVRIMGAGKGEVVQ
jgi:flagella basal body P-ring formation protein FlgA